MKSARRSFFVLLLTLVMLLTVMVVPVFASNGPLKIPPLEVSPEVLVVLAGGALSLGFSYIRGLNTAYAALAEETKKAIMAALLLVVVIAIYALGCGAILQTGISCDRQGIVELAYMFILAIMANQGVYKVSPQTTAVKDAKLSRPIA
jgi:hypothetical protein